MKKILALFTIFGLCLGFGLISSNDSFAVSDLTTTVNASNYSSYSNQPVFASCNDSACLSQYHYLTLTKDGTGSIVAHFNIKGYRGVNDAQVYVNSTSLIDGSTSLDFGGLFLIGAEQYTFILSEQPPNQECTNPSTGTLNVYQNGTYDVTTYAEVNVDIPVDTPPFIQIIIDAFWEYHTYFAGAVVSLIVIFLVYRLLKGRMR